MSRQIDVQDSVTIYPSDYDSSNSSYSSVSSSYPISNGYDSSSSTDYAYITCRTGSGAASYISYTFNVSGVPEEATIDSVSCTVKSRVSSTSYLTSSTIQLYSGSTAKGKSTSAASTSATARSISNTGSWTRSELDNIQVRLTGTRGTSNTNRAAYLYFYGADLTINYSISGIAYTVTATSTVSSATASPSTQELMAGETAIVRIDAKDLTGLLVTDNDTDITEQLEQHLLPTGGELEKYPESYTTSGIQSGEQYAAYCIGHSAEDPYSSSSNMYASRNENGYTEYSFDFSDIPENATITNVSITVNGHRESSTVSSTYVSRVQAYSGSSAKGEYYEFSSTSNETHTLENTGSWTRSELQNAKLRHTVGYYGGLVCGVTWSVTYDVPSTGNLYYWTYTITNIGVDHTILIDESGPFIPPDEDPDYTYYPITISSINAKTTPGTGTERVQEGTDHVVTIEPLDPKLTLALDNGVDISDQLVHLPPSNTYTITPKVSGADYGFNLNSSSGYYVSTNNGVSKSASVARLNMDFESDCLVTITYINYAEANYDYGLFGKLDTTVSTDGLTASSGGSVPSDSTSNYQLAMCSNSASQQTITYEVPAGQHYIDIKYGKDDASDDGNDSLQWKVTSVEASSAGGSYTYTLNNIAQKHSLVFIFGDVEYYFVTSSGSNIKLYPDGQSVLLAGYDYRLLIVPDDANAKVTLTDNNVDKTNLLQYEEATDKSGKKIVNYVYELTNVTAQHTIVVKCGISQHLFFKVSGSWREANKVYKKVNGSWVIQTDLASVFNNSTNYKAVIE